MNDQEIELFYEGIKLGSGNDYDEYDICLLASTYIFYNIKRPKIIVKAEDNDYQGSTYGIIYDPWGWIEGTNRKQFYYFNFGWGSCSGCDMLEGDGPIETIKQLRNDIVPIPTDTISITQYIKNEIQNGSNKGLIEEVLEKWEEWRKQNQFDEYGKAGWLNN